MSSEILNDLARTWIADGLMFGEIRKKEIGIEEAKALVKDRLRLSDNKVYAFLIDLRGVTTVSKEARDYLASEGSKQVNAAALLVKSHVEKTIGNFFLKINRPKTPTKLFTDKDLAIAWLNTLKMDSHS